PRLAIVNHRPQRTSPSSSQIFQVVTEIPNIRAAWSRVSIPGGMGARVGDEMSLVSWVMGAASRGARPRRRIVRDLTVIGQGLVQTTVRMTHAIAPPWPAAG